jgi:trans-aconitate methyltransferase
MIFTPLLDGLIDPLEVHTVIDLCCGQGIWTVMSLQNFPNTKVHSVDFHDVLITPLKAHERVIFHTGYIADFLASDTVPQANIVILSNVGKYHGLIDESIRCLANVTEMVITNGDTGSLLYMKSFHNYFSLIKGNPYSNDSCVWKKT